MILSATIHPDGDKWHKKSFMNSHDIICQLKPCGILYKFYLNKSSLNSNKTHGKSLLRMTNDWLWMWFSQRVGCSESVCWSACVCVCVLCKIIFYNFHLFYYEANIVSFVNIVMAFYKYCRCRCCYCCGWCARVVVVAFVADIKYNCLQHISLSTLCLCQVKFFPFVFAVFYFFLCFWFFFKFCQSINTFKWKARKFCFGIC